MGKEVVILFGILDLIYYLTLSPLSKHQKATSGLVMISAFNHTNLQIEYKKKCIKLNFHF